MFEPGSARKFQVVIAGGGVAALEAALALRQLAPSRVQVTLLTASQEFVMRPLAVREPFAYSHRAHHQLDPLLAQLDIERVADNLASVDPERLTLLTTSGLELTYDALLIASGARPAIRYEHAVTIDDRRLDELLHGMIQDIEGDYIHSLAFVAPPRMGWPLPLYELALMTAHRAWDMGIELSTTIITPEDQPLGVFGGAASRGVSTLLKDQGIHLMTSAHAEVPQRRQLVLNPGNRKLDVDRIIALPELFGPAISGLPHDEYGFVLIDEYGQVPDSGPVFAAGDVANYPIKHGGLAAQMADIAARSIAALAGAEVQPEPFDPVLRGVLLTGRKPRYLSAHRVGGHGFESEFSESPLWEPPSKISSRYLAPFLAQREHAAATG